MKEGETRQIQYETTDSSQLSISTCDPASDTCDANQRPLTNSTSTTLEEARHLFGIETYEELAELVSCFREVVVILEQWDIDSSNQLIETPVFESSYTEGQK